VSNEPSSDRFEFVKELRNKKAELQPRPFETTVVDELK
jgi:hypothetical protein